jgi:hypothetical protein
MKWKLSGQEAEPQLVFVPNCTQLPLPEAQSPVLPHSPLAAQGWAQQMLFVPQLPWAQFASVVQARPSDVRHFPFEAQVKPPAQPTPPPHEFAQAFAEHT